MDKREIILKHSQNPINKGLINDSTYICSNTNHESCVDEIDLMVKIEDDKITDILFDGEACAICTSSTSIMIDILIGKTLKEANEIITNFENMVENSTYDNTILGIANVFDDISKQQNRKKCALIPYYGIKSAINKYFENN